MLSRECGNEPRRPLKGNHKLDGFTGVIPFLIPCLSHQQANRVGSSLGIRKLRVPCLREDGRTNGTGVSWCRGPKADNISGILCCRTLLELEGLKGMFQQPLKTFRLFGNGSFGTSVLWLNQAVFFPYWTNEKVTHLLQRGQIQQPAIPLAF